MLNKSRYKFIIKILFSFILIFVMLFSTLSAHAKGSVDVTDNGYTYWEGNSSKFAVKNKSLYEPVFSVSGTDISGREFISLDYVFSYNKNLYIVDSQDGKIYILDTDYKLVRVIEAFEYKGKKITFKGAKGLYADESGIYVADTQNQRILCTDGKKVKNIIIRPDSYSVPSTLTFAPTRLVRDKKGYIYTLCEGSYYGLMVFSEKYDFLGFYGANKVKTTFTDALKKAVTSLFETEEKHNASTQTLPFQMVDVCIDNEGFICTVNGSSDGQIRRFGPAGTNILSHTRQFEYESGDSFNFGDEPISYLDSTGKYDKYIVQTFNSLSADTDGFYYATDSAKGRIFVYDVNCQLLGAFGGGVGKGSQLGMFVTPNAVCVFGNDLIVCDYKSKRITVFSLTEYGALLRKACQLSNLSEYKAAKPYWDKILKADKNNQLAYKGLANAALEEENYEKAMDYAKKGLDRVTYSHAFEKQKDIFLSNNFWWMAIVVVILLAGLVWFVIYSKKNQLVIVKNEKLAVSLNVPLHPIESFKQIKYKNKGSVLIACFYLVLFYLTSVTSKLNCGFMYNYVDTDNFNAIFVLLGSVGIALLFVVANWLICVLFEGKGHLKEIFCSTCYCLIPMIVYNVLYFIMSYTVIPSVNNSFAILSIVCKLFMIVLILLSVTVIHDFDFFKSIGTAVFTVVGMCIVGFVIFLMLTLFQDLLGFIVGIINEVTLR